MLIKVCGIRSCDEANDLKDLNVDFWGLIFAKSPRKVDLQSAKKIANILQNSAQNLEQNLDKNLENNLENNSIKNQQKAKLVALISLAESSFLDEILSTINFDAVQLHDNFSLEFCKNIAQKYTNIEIWRAFSVDNFLPSEIFDFIKAGIKPLLDTKSDLKGGSGKSFDWQILMQMPKKSFILAGGLDAKNAKKALEYQPYCLDFNSKLETQNRKDKTKVLEIINLIKN